MTTGLYRFSGAADDTAETLAILREVAAARGAPAGADPVALSRTVLSAMDSRDPVLSKAGFCAAEYLMAEDALTWSLRYLSALFRHPTQIRPAMARLEQANWLPAGLRDNLAEALARCVARNAPDGDADMLSAQRMKMADEGLRVYVAGLAEGKGGRFSPLRGLRLRRAGTEGRKRA